MITHTWGFTKDAAGWSIGPEPAADVGRSAAAANRWLAEITETTRTALQELARPWRTSFGSVAEPEAQPFLADWDPAAESATAYRDRVAAAIRDEPAPIHSIEVDLELNAYARTSDFARNSNPPMAAGAQRTSPTTANCSRSTPPVLDAGLRRWSHALGPITERLGYAWNY